MASSRPVLRYHGGKWRIAPWIISHFPPHEIYVEPFGGAASVLVRKSRSSAEVYNDLDEDVVNVFRVLRNPRRSARLKTLLFLTPYSRIEFLSSYRRTLDPVERARRTIIRSSMAHGTTGRRKHQTGFRSRCWAQRRNESLLWSEYHELIDGFVDRFKGVVIECRPALEVILQHDSPNTLFYLDPPYVLSTRSSIRGPWEENWRAYQYDLSDSQHMELLRLLREVQGMCVISGYPNPIYEEILFDWEVHEKEVSADAGRVRLEKLWISPNSIMKSGLLFGGT